MRTRFLALLGMSACAGIGLHKAAPDDVLVFEGRVDEAPIGIAAGEAAKLTRETVRGRDPRTGRVGAFRGLALAPLFSDGLPLRRGADLAVLHGEGGYRVAVPLNAIRQVHPVLADEADGQPLELPPKGDRYLLAWPDAEAPGLETDPRIRGWWVGGVRRVEVLSWQDADGKALRVPAGADDDARHGADAFATLCMACHRLRGRGGTVGPDLSAPPARPQAAWIPGHLAGRTGWGATRRPSPDDAAQVAAFLRVVAVADAARHGDDEEIKEPEPLPLPGQQPAQRRP